MTKISQFCKQPTFVQERVSFWESFCENFYVFCFPALGVAGYPCVLSIIGGRTCPAR